MNENNSKPANDKKPKPSKANIAIALLAVATLVFVTLNIIFITKNVKLDQQLQDAEARASKAKDDMEFDAFHISTYNNQPYFIQGGSFGLYYPDAHDIKYLNFDIDDESYLDLPYKSFLSFQDYLEFCDNWNIKPTYKSEQYRSSSFVVFTYSVKTTGNIHADLIDVQEYNGVVNLYVRDYIDSVIPGAAPDYVRSYAIIVPVDAYDYRAYYNDNNSGHINIIPVISQAAYNRVVNNLPPEDDYDRLQEVEKPIIYLYPTTETNVSIKLGRPDLLTHSYPKYIDEWNVVASPNGKLIDTKTNRELYALYYESQAETDYELRDEGFVVAGTDTIDFLEEKLAILGLNARESEEFITYWLPKLEQNTYNYIRFATQSEITANMPLHVNPQPDTVIRVMMTYKALDAPISVTEQHLEAPVRSGFTLVEWGGTEIE